jgi:hypothetical protein
MYYSVDGQNPAIKGQSDLVEKAPTKEREMSKGKNVGFHVKVHNTKLPTNTGNNGYLDVCAACMSYLVDFLLPSQTHCVGA